jgi:predicted N-acetyltransferase YhbS
MEIQYTYLDRTDINLDLFLAFNRYQQVQKCWRKENGEWILKDIAFLEQWNVAEKEKLVQFLRNTCASGGTVLGAFHQQILVGFASLEQERLGTEQQYLQLSCMHVNYEYRGQRIGKGLFIRISQKAKEMGAKKLYISGHSSQESQAFYRRMGCADALEVQARMVEEEPGDCQLEYVL